jgi:hypothetical protein
LANPDDSGGAVAFEDSAVFSEGELARSVLCGLPIRVFCTALDIVDHLTIKVEWNAKLDEGFNFALLSDYSVSGRLD